ncbi:MAG TPA: hypothetical protein PKJ99_02810 [Thermoanaerobaculales bacterium]|nr:hypothetical protein [Thermoanaerobaculales bacterium]HPA80261.1 hypothetical protein [Thermoanaerobaculales bacterium]HQN95504.1 hypothetical protein [Thermoanaerobaculales bacterium]HQP44534.1 hypothetical protein [Thermoanaerobaculales bacterium]
MHHWISMAFTLSLVAMPAFAGQAVAADDATSEPWACRELGGMSCERELEEFLRSADVVAIEDIGDGITRPRRVTLLKDGRHARAIFKTVDITSTDVAYTNRFEQVFTDRYVYEVAAYRIDRMLGIGLVPVTVLRSINGEVGSLQLWIEGAIKIQDAFDRDLPIGDAGLMLQRLMLMYVLDAMIYNIDRNFTNILVRPERDHLFLIDHSRAFRTAKKLPSLKEERPIPVPDRVARGLRELDLEALTSELDDLLKPQQIRAVEARRRLLIDELSDRGVLPDVG